jgi:DNA helicase-2/ATP-dependent DNA helicase PcrA
VIEPPATSPVPLPELNGPQADAVAHVHGPLLVFAGAGSGKTRVITYRIANLVAVHRVAPFKILAVTFTNKAAGEMRARLDKLIGPDVTRDLWVGTFHATAVRLLRRYHEAAGLERGFVIYDDGDQRAVMARVVKDLDIDDRRYPPKQLLHRVHKEKQEGRGPEDYVPDSYVGDVVAKVFAEYERRLKDANAVDFEDLLLKTLRLAEDKGLVGEELRRRFEHVLVDEFQDTNQVQYRLVRAFVQESRNLCVVGDDDQSIYRWRGADVRNIRGFKRDFPEALVVKLEQNYRSTGHIVKAALGVIQPARDREPKELWTARRDGEPIVNLAADSERDEAAWVVERVKEALARGLPANEIAIFYRVHAQSRVLEDVMRAENVPYQIVGGVRFFERAEVKDLLSYLRVISNPRSDVDLLRVINVPPRKIGATTIERLVATADARGSSLYDALQPAIDSGTLGTPAKKALFGFRALLQDLIRQGRDLGPREIAEKVLEGTGYNKILGAEDTAEADARLQNLQELLGSIEEYETEAEAGDEPPSLAGYLERISLSAAIDGLEDAPRVPMMTVHGAKGLEFNTVFLIGMEEEMFPFRGLDPQHAEELEEERRLCYVAVTRARERLFISHAQRRAIFGTTRYGMPSRFLRDLPKGSLRPMVTETMGSFGAYRTQRDDLGATMTRARDAWQHPFERGRIDPPAFTGRMAPPRPEPVREVGERFVEAVHDDGSGELPFRAGMRVTHARYGPGTISALDGGDDPTATVKFRGWGDKRIKARFLVPA